MEIYEYPQDWCKIGDVLTVRGDLAERRYDFICCGKNVFDNAIENMMSFRERRVKVCRMWSDGRIRVVESGYNWTPNMFEEFKNGMPVNISMEAFLELYKD